MVHSPDLEAAGRGPRRFPVQPPTLNTLQRQGALVPSYTPVSATSLSTPFSPWASASLSPLGAAASSPMAMAPRSATTLVPQYNPQQWQGQSGLPRAGYGSQVVISPAPPRQGEMTGLEATLPTPPPPYTPAPHQESSTSTPVGPSSANTAHVTSPGVFSTDGAPTFTATPSSSHSYGSQGQSSRTSVAAAHASPHPVSAHSYPPPPPPAADRSTSSSGADRQHSVFGLSALTSRNKPPSQVRAASAIDTLRNTTSEALALSSPHGLDQSNAAPQANVLTPEQNEQRWTVAIEQYPPAARRAASTGGIGVIHGAGGSTPESRSTSQTRAWEPGAPLPPPPPGPPPSTARSQSLNRASNDSTPRSHLTPLAVPHSRAPARVGSSLGPIPPTPAGWTEETGYRSRSPSTHGLRINTGQEVTNQVPVRNPTGDHMSVSKLMHSTSSDLTASSSSASASSLTRTPARRDLSARGIRERRSESRARKASQADQLEQIQNEEILNREGGSTNATPVDLSISRGLKLPFQRPSTAEGTPHEGPVSLSTNPSVSAATRNAGGELSESEHRFNWQKGQARGAIAAKNFGPTPPFSPAAERGHSLSRFDPGTYTRQDALPTPPLQRSTEGLPAAARRRPSQRSLLSHSQSSLPDLDSAGTGTHSRQSSATPLERTGSLDTTSSFASEAIIRHQLFIERESNAATDQERLELFADFMVHESRLRRDRYTEAFESMASDILDLTRDMWRPLNVGKRPHASSTSKRSGKQPLQPDVSMNADDVPSASPASSRHYTPSSETASPDDTVTPMRLRGESGFQPSLSPIQSMAMSTVPDEERDSRGRSASRWWEASTEDSIGRGGRKIERSKRESKYMGLPLEARLNLQWEDQPSPAYSDKGEAQTTPYGPNEYPPEKGPFQDRRASNSSMQQQFGPISTPNTPRPSQLDISRLITLPPPYPRHHPAVNNKHPALASIRTIHRALVDQDDVEAIRQKYTTKANALSAQEAANGTQLPSPQGMRYRPNTQAEFELFKFDLMSPLHALYSERVNKASAAMTHLRDSLDGDAQNSNPNQPQEEGDEQPETLEKLTLLKWLFEAREQLHNKLFELEEERSNRYKDLILTPYVFAGHHEKIREVQDFFLRDERDRRLAFDKRSLRRWEQYMNIIEDSVSRGVDVQSSAFWDIAPGLLEIVHKIPASLDRLELFVPAQEYEENPSYHEHPLQYLYSLLMHAEKSASQFTESQTNLFCLSHEVKTGVMHAGSRLLQTQRIIEGENAAEVEAETQAIRQEEEARLTVALKEHVALVDSQWRDGLGKGVGECKERVEAFLVQSGGWDDTLKE